MWIDEQEVKQVYGLQPHHRLVCHALGLDSSWYAMPLAWGMVGMARPLEHGLGVCKSLN